MNKLSKLLILWTAVLGQIFMLKMSILLSKRCRYSLVCMLFIYPLSSNAQVIGAESLSTNTNQFESQALKQENKTTSNSIRNCAEIKKSRRCDVCFDGGVIVVGDENAFKPVLNFTAGTSDLVYFDDENTTVYEFKTLRPKSTTWGVSYNLLEYPDEFTWNTYEGRLVHLFRAGKEERTLQTQDNKGIRALELNKVFDDAYDFRFKFITQTRKVIGRNKFSKKTRRKTCVFYKAEG